ncbi:hypothetical protein AB2T90_11160 [Clostridium butyricum]|uniref:hypothetical protein n=1 Tax=Clostridium butyricum TaxID=1492 RepID=UPI0034665B1C
MNLNKEDFETLQSVCKHLYIGDHHSRNLCNEYEGWIDCTYEHCSKIMKPCNGLMRIDGEIVAEITAVNKII